MPQKPLPPGSQPPRPDSRADLALLLRDAVRHSVQIEREAALPQVRKPSRAKPIAIGTLCVLLLGLSAYSFIARPEFIWGTHSGAIPAPRAEASVRVAMYLMARRLDAYRAREGVFPATLSAVGGDTTLGYRQDGERFELFTTVNGSRVALGSADDRTAFLGSSFDIVQQKVGR